MTEQPMEQSVVRVDAGEVLARIEATHPEIVHRAVWQVRAEKAEAELAALRAEQSA